MKVRVCAEVSAAGAAAPEQVTVTSELGARPANLTQMFSAEPPSSNSRPVWAASLQSVILTSASTMRTSVAAKVMLLAPPQETAVAVSGMLFVVSVLLALGVMETVALPVFLPAGMVMLGAVKAA